MSTLPPEDWVCPGCGAHVEPSAVRLHTEVCDLVDGAGQAVVNKAAVPTQGTKRVGSRSLTKAEALKVHAVAKALTAEKSPFISYDYLDHLSELIPKGPPAVVVYSVDDEGNEFKPIVGWPTLGHYEHGTFTPDDGTEEFKSKINALCLN